MAYLCVFTDPNNAISFDVADSIHNDNPERYLEFAKYVENPYEKAAILQSMSPLCLSDYYMIFSLMDGQLWTPLTQDVSENLVVIQEYINNMIIDNLIIDTIEEEPEISDPD
jgi:hypothetical protein